MQPQDLGLVLIAITVGAAATFVITKRKPQMRHVHVAAGVVIVATLVGLLLLFLASFIGGWSGGIGD